MREEATGAPFFTYHSSRIIWLSLRSEALAEFIKRFDVGGKARFFGKHDRDAVAHRVSQSTLFGDQPIALLPQDAARDRAAQQAQDFGSHDVARDGFGSGLHEFNWLKQSWLR